MPLLEPPRVTAVYGDCPGTVRHRHDVERVRRIAIIGATGGNRHPSIHRRSIHGRITAFSSKGRRRRAAGGAIVKLGIALVPEGRGCFLRSP